MMCAVALLLLLDGSGSMLRDFATQREETARAVESSEVVQAIQQQGAVAISVMQFGNRTRIEVLWVVLQSATHTQNLAAQIRRVEFMNDANTNIGVAIEEATGHFSNLQECSPDEQIIDISTDGIDMGFRGQEVARDAAQLAGIRINVIAVGAEDDVAPLREYVMTADGFVLHTYSWEQYAALFRRKIIFELAGRMP